MYRSIVEKVGKKIFLCMMILICYSQISYADSLVDQKTFFSEEFTGETHVWQSNMLELKDGKGILSVGKTKKNEGNLILFNQPFTLPTEKEQYLHSQVKLDGFSETSGKKELKASARIFFIPERPQWIEPYSNPNVIWISINYDTTKDTLISLYSKINQPDTNGNLLYQGSLPIDKFPLTIDLYLNLETYQIKFDQDVNTNQGSRSGYHKLPTDLWTKDIWFGARIVNSEDGVNAQIIFDKVVITLAEKKEKLP